MYKSTLSSLLRYGLMVLCLGYSFVACGPDTSKSDGSVTEPSVESTSEVAKEKSIEVSSQEPGKEPTVSEDPKESNDADASESTSEPVAETPPIDCVLSCGDVRSKCVDRDNVSKCEAKAGCAVWTTEPCGGGKECKDGKCIVRTCNGPGECGKDFHCEKGACESNAKCCKGGTSECKSNATRKCENGPDGCGVWSTSTPCKSGEGCNQNKCDVCRHRKCTGPFGCCPKTTCVQGYCLPHCDKTKGFDNNPDCSSNEFCFEIQTGGQAMCLVDFTEPKGAKCSIIKLCKSGLSCVKLSTDFTCHADCKPNKTPSDCGAQETCVLAGNTPKGGVCAPAKKKHEVCNATNPCESGHVCIGEPNNPTHCLQECNPQKVPSGCPSTDLCAAYKANDPSKGICVQACTNPGTKDTCTYGQCRLRQSEKVCL